MYSSNHNHNKVAIIRERTLHYMVMSLLHTLCHIMLTHEILITLNHVCSNFILFPSSYFEHIRIVFFIFYDISHVDLKNKQNNIALKCTLVFF